MSNKNGKIDYDHIPDNYQELLVDVDVFLKKKKISKKSIFSLTIKDPISRNNFISDGDIILYELSDKSIGVHNMYLDDAKILNLDIIGGPIWSGVNSYIHNLSSIGKLSKDQVIDYINKLDIDPTILFDKFSSIPIEHSNFRKSPIYSLMKMSSSDLSILIKRCLINYDLSLKYKSNDTSRMNNPEIRMLLSEFLKRNEDLSKKVGISTLSHNNMIADISRLYQMSDYMIPILFEDTDTLLSWYNKIVFI